MRVAPLANPESAGGFPVDNRLNARWMPRILPGKIPSATTPHRPPPDLSGPLEARHLSPEMASSPPRVSEPAPSTKPRTGYPGAKVGCNAGSREPARRKWQQYGPGDVPGGYLTDRHMQPGTMEPRVRPYTKTSEPPVSPTDMPESLTAT